MLWKSDSRGLTARCLVPRPGQLIDYTCDAGEESATLDLDRR